MRLARAGFPPLDGDDRNACRLRQVRELLVRYCNGYVLAFGQDESGIVPRTPRCAR